MVTLGPDIALGAITDMNRSIAHRGPDDEGMELGDSFALGMRRLSIIGVANGRQPIYNEDRSLVLVFNGELYNYRALKHELETRGHQFETDSDAEVIVHLYEEEGKRLVDRLRGMYGFALYDRRQETLWLVRDRAGKKPIYYCHSDRSFVFGSEIKALFASGEVQKELDEAAVGTYLAYGFVPGARTLFRGIRKLPAGHMLTLSNGTAEIEQYWDLGLERQSRMTLEEAARRTHDLIEEAVEIRLMSEVPLGAFLSGGIDSSAVVAFMSKLMKEPPQTFAVGFGDGSLDETAHARAVADRLGARHHEILVHGCTPDLLYGINWFQDDPAGDPASVPTFLLSRFARQHITVALTGEGGDEAFAGYRHHRFCRSFGRVQSKAPWLMSPRFLFAAGERMMRGWLSPRVTKAMWLASLDLEERALGWTSAFTDGEIAKLAPGGRLEDFWIGRRELLGELPRRVARHDTDDALADLLYVDAKFALADHLLMKVDRMSMAAGLEARCPLLDHHLLELAASLPTELLLADGVSKRVLKTAVADLLPREILERPKQGFDVPIRTWLRGPLLPTVEGLVLDSGAPLGRLIETSTVHGLWRRLQKRNDSRIADQLWRILNLAVWLDLHWGDGAQFAERWGAAGISNEEEAAWSGLGVAA